MGLKITTGNKSSIGTSMSTNLLSNHIVSYQSIASYQDWYQCVLIKPYLLLVGNIISCRFISFGRLFNCLWGCGAYRWYIRRTCICNLWNTSDYTPISYCMLCSSTLLKPLTRRLEMASGRYSPNLGALLIL